MSFKNIIDLVIQRKASLGFLNAAREAYVKNPTAENFEIFNSSRQDYQSYYGLIYTHSTCVELFRLIAEFGPEQQTLYSNQEFHLTLYRSKNGMPTLTLAHTTKEEIGL